MIPAKHVVPQGWMSGWFGFFVVVVCHLFFFLRKHTNFYTKSVWRASGCVKYVKSHYATAVLKVLFLAQLLSLYDSSKQPCSGKQTDQSIVGQVQAAAPLMTKVSCVAADTASSILWFGSPATSLPAPPPCARGSRVHNRLYLLSKDMAYSAD